MCPSELCFTSRYIEIESQRPGEIEGEKNRALWSGSHLRIGQAPETVELNILLYPCQEKAFTQT